MDVECAVCLQRWDCSVRIISILYSTTLSCIAYSAGEPANLNVIHMEPDDQPPFLDKLASVAEEENNFLCMFLDVNAFQTTVLEWWFKLYEYLLNTDIPINKLTVSWPWAIMIFSDCFSGWSGPPIGSSWSRVKDAFSWGNMSYHWSTISLIESAA